MYLEKYVGTNNTRGIAVFLKTNWSSRTCICVNGTCNRYHQWIRYLNQFTITIDHLLACPACWPIQRIQLTIYRSFSHLLFWRGPKEKIQLVSLRLSKCQGCEAWENVENLYKCNRCDRCERLIIWSVQIWRLLVENCFVEAVSLSMESLIGEVAFRDCTVPKNVILNFFEVVKREDALIRHTAGNIGAAGIQREELSEKNMDTISQDLLTASNMDYMAIRSTPPTKIVFSTRFQWLFGEKSSIPRSCGPEQWSN